MLYADLFLAKYILQEIKHDGFTLKTKQKQKGINPTFTVQTSFQH